jgi:hypothetical protein
VPEQYQQPTTKGEIALSLVHKLRAENHLPGYEGLIADNSYVTAHELVDGLKSLGMKLGELTMPDSSALLTEANRRLEWLGTALGLSHFEGRTWLGWHHHVSLVFVAYGFLAQEQIWANSATSR